MATPFPFFSWLPWIFVVVQRLLLLQSTGSLAHGLKSCGSGASLSYGKWDLCSLTRDRTHVPCIGRHWKVDEMVMWVQSLRASFDVIFSLLPYVKTASCSFPLIGKEGEFGMFYSWAFMTAPKLHFKNSIF